MLIRKVFTLFMVFGFFVSPFLATAMGIFFSDKDKNEIVLDLEDRPPVCHKPVRRCVGEEGKECIDFAYSESMIDGSYAYMTPSDLRHACFVENSFEFRYYIPKNLRELCRFVKTNFHNLSSKINCISSSGFSPCQKMMKEKIEAHQADTLAYKKCQELGHETYNNRVEASLRRSSDCLYTYEKVEHGSPKRMWRDLMPSSCGEGAFVADNGIECCTKDDFHNSCVGSCGSYYVKRKIDLGSAGFSP